ncbi:MAG: histidinol-phosphate transaminase [SAR324 cluster bacterium]|nr:histidinol-phosphate transaminase [SAR324 cluster bacterium]
MKNSYQPGLTIADVHSKTGGIKVYKMSSNENPFGPSPKAVEAIAVDLKGLHFYPERHDTVVREALVSYHKRGLTVENFTTGHGAVDLIGLIEDASFDHSNSVVVCPPAFGSYVSSAAKKGAEIIECPLDPETFQIDSGMLSRAVRSNTKLVYVCNPNNPTGTCFGQQELEKILECIPSGTLLVYDAVYFQYATEIELPDAIQCVLDKRNIVILHSFSKVFGLAGMRIGYAISTPEIIAKIASGKRSFHMSSSSMVAMIAALQDQEHISITLENNTKQRHWLQKELENLNIRVWPSQANFLLFECPGDLMAKDLVDRLLSFGVMVRAAFDLPHHVRVTVSLPEANLQFIAAMREIVDHLKMES